MREVGRLAGVALVAGDWERQGVSPVLSVTRRLGVAGLVLGRERRGITVGRSAEAKGGELVLLAVAPGRSVCLWQRLTHRARGRGNAEEAGVATPLGQVRSTGGGKGFKGLGMS